MNQPPCTLAFSTHLGWAAVAAVRCRGSDITGLRTYRMETAEPGNRDMLEPYHVAGGFEGLTRVPPPADPAAVVKRGLKGQTRYTLAQLKVLQRDLGDWKATHALIFTGRGRLASTLEKILASHAQIHIAEGEAVRDAIRQGCEMLGLKVIGQDKRSLPDALLTGLELDETAALKELSTIRPDNEGPWRKEEKLCALAALLV